MKSIFSSLIVILISTSVYGQITISTSDMPSPGDTFRISNGLITPLIDPVSTGAQQTWDFSSLQMVTQDIDSFVSVSSTGSIYSVVFINLPFNPYRSNLAAKGPVLPTIPQISISDVVNFYYNSTASYKVTGYGANINGISAPIPFNNQDRVYEFPVAFGNQDSSDSDFQLTIPGMGFYGHNQHRVNDVDGWGTLITPFGTFDAVRIKSQITSNDSLYIDSLSTGFGFSLPPTTEYKWLGVQSGIPLLQINTTNTLGTEVISSIVYRDSIRVLNTGIETVSSEPQPSMNIYPNPANDIFNMEFSVPVAQKISISLHSMEGVLIRQLWSGNKGQGKFSMEFDADKLKLGAGVYLIKMETTLSQQYKLLVINK